MRDIFSEGLLYLDLLEIYGSTYAVAEICGIAQSNVFRGANSCAKLLNLGLSKDKQGGSYRIERNHDVQRDLRRLNQKMRARENGQLRLVGAEVLLQSSSTSLDQARNFQSLPERWSSKEISLEYLEKSLLDVVITRACQVRSRMNWPPSVRRRDLFVPIDSVVATELCEVPLVLLARSSHPLIGSFSVADFYQVEWLVDQNLLLEWAQQAFPSVDMHPWQASRASDIASQGDSLLMLTDWHTFSRLKTEDPTLDLQPLNVDLGLKDYLLAISLPALIIEPMHQSLIRHLRDIANRLTVAKAEPRS